MSRYCSSNSTPHDKGPSFIDTLYYMRLLVVRAVCIFSSTLLVLVQLVTLYSTLDFSILLSACVIQSGSKMRARARAPSRPFFAERNRVDPAEI